MKKLLAMLLAMVMVFSLAACAQGGTTNGVSATEKTAAPDNNGEKDSSTSTGDSDSIDVGVCLTITGSGAPNGRSCWPACKSTLIWSMKREV